MTHRSRNIAAVVLAALLMARVASAAEWRWIVTTDSQRWVEHLPVPATPAPVPAVAEPTVPPTTAPYPPPDLEPREKLTVVIDPSAVAQRIDGWGGCFNEIGWRALLRLDEIDRQLVMRSLFDDKQGLGFNICRLPIGASDFALSAYSLDDVSGDLELKHFSIERDRFMLIPYIKAALAIRPDLKLWASPWSPPAWMKATGIYHGGSIKQDPAILKAYATYLARFVEAYAGDGITISQVHVQNEPRIDNKYPTCQWLDPATMRDFIRDYAAPTWAERKVPAELWFGTVTNSDYAWFKTVLDDPKVQQSIRGLGIQYETRKIAADLHAAYPKLQMMETETRCYNGANSWVEAEDTFGSMQDFIRGGCSAYMYWNMVLDETGRSSWGWSQDSTIVVSQYDGGITFTPQYFLMKHLSAFVKPGSTFLKSTVNADPVLAFKTADGGVAAVLLNTSRFDRTFEVHIGGQSASIVLPGHSFNTVIAPASGG